MASKTLYVLYNADASVMGKLRYGYKKICNQKADDNPECAACEITHGGLSLKETPEWVEAKKEIEGPGSVKVVQWHRDELSSELKKYIQDNQIAYPSVILEEGGAYKVVADKSELATYKGDAKVFVKELRSKGVV